MATLTGETMPWLLQSQELGAASVGFGWGVELVVFCSSILPDIPVTQKMRSISARNVNMYDSIYKALQQPTYSHLCPPLLHGEVVPLVHPASPGHLAGIEVLVVLHHPVVVLHEDGLPHGQLCLGLVLLALLLRPLEEDILVGQADRNQGAQDEQMKPEDGH